MEYGKNTVGVYYKIKNGENKQYENKAPRPPDANCPESSAVSSSRPQQLQSAFRVAHAAQEAEPLLSR